MEASNTFQNKTKVCSETSCVNGDDDRKIKCTKCKRLVHFACTNLPIYQLRLFFTKGYRGFICVNCVEVPEEFMEKFEKQEQSIAATLKREIQACESIIMVQRENESKILNGYKQMKEKARKEGQENSEYASMVEKINQLENTIKDGFEKVLEINPVRDMQGEVKNSFADAVNLNKSTIIPEFRKVLLDEKLNEFEEERQKDLRMTNAMIFGRKESNEEDDRSFVNSLIVDAGCEGEIKFVTRIGERSSNRIRPIKLVFQSAFHRVMLMKRLKNLKGKSQYQGISVNEDLTIFERKIVKEWTNKAKAKNTKEPSDSTFVWRVRGSPSRGLYLKKAEKVKTNQQKENII